jgi:two-component system sensor histidine kinase PilS (NtrC family)
MADQPALQTLPSQAPADMQNVTLFRIYAGYRLLLSILLLLSLASSDTRQLLGTLNPDLFLYTALAYLATNLVPLAVVRSQHANNQALLFVIFFIDILAIILLADSSGGMSSGLPILLIITVAASAILIKTGTTATLIAALSVIAILVDTLRLINEQALSLNSLLPAGLLGMLIFAVSLLIQVVARRVGMAEALARKRAADLYNLQRLNEQIVQHMQIGILLVFADGSVRVMNQAATRLLDPDRPLPLEQGRQLLDYNSQLATQFTQWQNSGSHSPVPIEISADEPWVIANFRHLQNTGGDALVFIEDYTPITAHAQSLKLASLGRLTASIAHEIRNPLGAVSHAAQLLGESDKLAPEDARMADIIQHNSQRMNAIIENVMQISRRQPPNPQRLELKSWLHNYLLDYSATLEQTPAITLEANAASTADFDPEHLRRILGNLLDNALRHSKLDTGTANATVHLSQDPLSRRSSLDVIDEGEGVPVAERAKLFEPFYTTVEKGTGLGLFMCKELCEINNASLTYRFTPDKRSCFRIAISQPQPNQ